MAASSAARRCSRLTAPRQTARRSHGLRPADSPETPSQRQTMPEVALGPGQPRSASQPLWPRCPAISGLFSTAQ
eukprot:scaffold32929_cov55-Phaeocystis_antarctica.AAC.2